VTGTSTTDLIEELKQRVIELEGIIAGDYDKHLRFGITTREAIILGALARREALNIEQMQVLLKRDVTDDTGGCSRNLCSQLIKRLRKKLRPHGIEIRTRWAAGYYLSQEDKAKLCDGPQRPSSHG
jgi:DNA-binding response OmpR family regulator